MSAIGPKRTSPTALPAFEPKRVSRERSHNCCKAAHYGRWIKAVAQSYLRGADMSLKAILAAKGNEVVSISSSPVSWRRKLDIVGPIKPRVCGLLPQSLWY
jgi:hypothetical protein